MQSEKNQLFFESGLQNQENVSSQGKKGSCLWLILLSPCHSWSLKFVQTMSSKLLRKSKMPSRKCWKGIEMNAEKLQNSHQPKRNQTRKNRIKELGTQGTSHQQKQKQTEAMNRQRQEGEQRLKTQTLTMRRGTGEERERREEARWGNEGGNTEEKTLTGRGRHTATRGIHRRT